jgi:signal transduction histidine kinase
LRIRTPGEESQLAKLRTRTIALATVLVVLILLYFVARSFTLYQAMERSYGLEINTATDAVNTTEELYQAQIALTRTHVQVVRFVAKQISADDLIDSLDAAESIFSHFSPNEPIGIWLSKVASFQEAQVSVSGYFPLARSLATGAIVYDDVQRSYEEASRNWSLLTTDTISMGNISNLRRLTSQTLKIMAGMLALCVVVLIVAVYAGLRISNASGRQFKRLELMASSIGHDLKSPLMVIQQASDAMGKPDLIESNRLKNAKLISTSVAIMRRLIDDVLNVMLRSKLSIDKKSINVTEWAEAMSLVGQQKASIKGLNWHMTAKLSGIDRIDADPDRLTQCVGNLVNNAIRYTDQGSVALEVSLEEAGDGGRLILLVEDTGPGIAEADQQRIFEPFERGRNSAKHTNGLGLGLTIVTGLVEAMSGTLTMTSQLGAGSKFKISIPVTISSGVASQRVIETETTSFSDSKPPNPDAEILIVDDDGEILNLIAEALIDAGFEVDKASGGQQALDMAEKHHYKVILTDIQMPGMDGIELARSIREKGIDSTLIGMSAGLVKSQMSGDLLQMNAVISKPFTNQELLDVLVPFGL